MDTEIEEAAAYAARLIVDQHCGWALARTKLTEAFGKRCPMPSGADVETAVREHLSIFYPDHPAIARRAPRERPLSCRISLRPALRPTSRVPC